MTRPAGASAFRNTPKRGDALGRALQERITSIRENHRVVTATQFCGLDQARLDRRGNAAARQMPPRKLHELGNRLEPGDVVAEHLQPNQIPPCPAARQQHAVSWSQESTVEMRLGGAEAGVDFNGRDVEHAY